MEKCVYHDPQTDSHLNEVQDLYIFGSEINRNFRRVGPWHSIDAKYQSEMVERIAATHAVPCTKRDCDGAVYYHNQKHQSYRYQSPSLSADSRNLLTPRTDSTGSSIGSDPPVAMRRERMSGRKVRMSYMPCSASSRGSSISCENRRLSTSFQSVSEEELSQIVNRVTKPTMASRGGVDLLEKFRNKDFVYGTRTENTEDLDNIVLRVTKPTVASTGGVGKERFYNGYVYGAQKFSTEKVHELTQRLTKPTVSSRGGIDLASKDFQYIVLPKQKTRVVIPGIEEKFKGKKTVNSDEIQRMVDRLSKLTPAYKAKFSPNRNCWVDNSKRGPVFQRSIAVN